MNNEPVPGAEPVVPAEPVPTAAPAEPVPDKKALVKKVIKKLEESD